MTDFNTSLVREKIIMVFMDNDHSNEDDPIIIRSNRIYMSLVKKDIVEKLVVRGQNMGDTLRMAAFVIDEHYKGGVLTSRKIEWDKIWERAVSEYGRKYNAENNWVAVYIDGNPVYQTNKSPFTDVIEQCALTTLEHYDETINVAEMALEKIGRKVKIEHSINIAMTLSDNGKLTRTGIMNRNDKHNYTLTFTATGGKIREGRILRSLINAAAFLEAINLVMFIKKAVQEDISVDKWQLLAAKRRRTELMREINKFERSYVVNYRPEKINFFEDV